MPFTVSIVVPLYNEESVLHELYNRLGGILKLHNIAYEIILVNDGSSDNTFTIAKSLCREDKEIKLISFSRNFGHQIAITAGMDKASGKAIIIIDADLQDPPEVIIEMINKWKEGYHVVYGVRKKRIGESFFKLASANLFYRILTKMTRVNIPVDAGDFRLLDAKVVEQLKKMKERSRFIRGMVSWVGFRQCQVEYIREKRFAGETKYPLKKMIRFALDGILSFSEVPLKFSSAFGFLCSGFSFILIIYGFVSKLFFPETTIPGWTSIFVASMFLGGVQLICIGILGEYIGRVYDEIKGRPLYIVDEEINFD